jgi:quercetin dioxygenase-like cupin family protein
MTKRIQGPMNKMLAATCICCGLGLALGFAGGSSLAQMAAPTEHKGVSVKALGTVSEDSLKAQIGLEGYILQMRAVTVEAGGQIKKHDHAKRPGLVKMLSGELIEGTPSGEQTFNAASDAVIVERKDTVHWVFNRTDKAATALVCGITKVK